MENFIRVKTRQELRDWLEEHSTTEKCCWIIVSMAEQPNVIQYVDAVEEALCVGWIDGIKKKISDTELAQRLSPRKKNSHWTELNKERVRRLDKLGLMREEGMKALPDMRPESFTIDKDIETRLKEDEQLYQNFIHFPELYRRIRIDTIQSYRNEPDIFNKRLKKFIDHTRENNMYGQWNDNGRLIDY
ncbi:YdeI/OmpD-associated family protein [Shouchella clausii]|uniref:YdeI/OmpD-associated family protein n=1 Tax=Shouchella clausii TaxID=79880 RepID=UPI000B964C84|nr:YdeI/OmpD-associated family protein [Shouchella clausii]AST96650.1 thymidylate synthase [Shouchella clausii]MCR1289386.1 YdeI/OmpD-associated family protein [Shouchella clausii]MEB5473591.1 YdeI/OmpD-associated family protein [Shouchella clausii]QNM43006.1 thymidylate synthase [Shouchella clausii]WQG94133.1 YdeI/OmpD-associated family protein [Shouchella clausii]